MWTEKRAYMNISQTADMNLGELKAGESCVVVSVGGQGALRQHFLDMGIIPGAEITIVKFAPLGDPVEVRIHGYELSLRLDDAAKIAVTKIDKTEEAEAPKKSKKTHTAHPYPVCITIRKQKSPFPTITFCHSPW